MLRSLKPFEQSAEVILKHVLPLQLALGYVVQHLAGIFDSKSIVKVSRN